MNGSGENRYVKNWEKLSCMLRRKFPCAICGENDFKKKQCHHIDGNKRNGELSNAIVLCEDCHLDVHRKRKDIPSDFKGYNYSLERRRVIRSNG